jgi:hypothetical protein
MSDPQIVSLGIGGLLLGFVFRTLWRQDAGWQGVLAAARQDAKDARDDAATARADAAEARKDAAAARLDAAAARAAEAECRTRLADMAARISHLEDRPPAGD